MLCNFFAFVKAMINPERRSKPVSKYNAMHIATCFLDMLFWSWRYIELCKLHFKNFTSELFNSAHNEWNLSECSNHSYLNVPLYHPTFSKTGSPSKHIKDFVNLEKLFKSCKAVQSLFMAQGNLHVAFTTCFGMAYFKMFWVHIHEK